MKSSWLEWKAKLKKVILQKDTTKSDGQREKGFSLAYMHENILKDAEDIAIYLCKCGLSEEFVNATVKSYYSTARLYALILLCAIQDIDHTEIMTKKIDQKSGSYRMYKISYFEKIRLRHLAITWLFGNRSGYQDVKATQVCELVGVDIRQLQIYLRQKVRDEQIMETCELLDNEEQEVLEQTEPEKKFLKHLKQGKQNFLISNRYDFLIGIDTGLTCAVAVLAKSGQLIAIHDLPTGGNGKGKAKVKNQISAPELASILQLYPNAIACLESLASRPGQGVASVFSLGDSFGCIRGTLGALRIPFILVSPNSWKTACGIAKGADKDYSRTLALQLFPSAEIGLKKHHNRAEALLLARHILKSAH